MTDSDIIRLFFDRDEQAIAETTAKYGKYCMTIAKDILDSEQDAEECVSDVYLRVWNSIRPQMSPTPRSGFLPIIRLFFGNLPKPLVNSDILCYNKR